MLRGLVAIAQSEQAVVADRRRRGSGELLICRNGTQ